jgi:RHS repeat-associated protein
VTKWDLPGTGTAKTETVITPITVNRTLLPSVIEVIDPTQSNKQMALTNLFYNAAGDLNKKQRWTSGSNYLTTLYSPHSNGTPGTVTDPNATVTTMHYTSGICNELVPTSITNNFNSLSSSLTLDTGCRQSLAVAQTPVSGFASAQTYNDPLFRMDTHTDEAGNTITTDYRLNITTTTEPFNGSSLDHWTTLDSLGRPVNDQTYNGTNYDTVQTTYDAMGRVSFVSVPFPCSTIGNCSYSYGTTTTYDAASRVSTVTDNVYNGTVTHTYSVQAGKGTVDLSVLTPTPAGDQSTNGKRRAMQYNGLEQLINVCEINSNSDSSACGLGLSNTGYVTTYSYDALGNMIGVLQGSESRTFYFDGLSRMTGEINPETGTTYYGYDSNSTCGNSSAGDLAYVGTNSDAYTCFWYDGLHRLTIKTHGGSKGSVTDNQFFAWDTGNQSPAGAIGQGGKIASAWTCGPGQTGSCAAKTAELFQYDSRGNTTGFYQLSPNSGGWYGVAVSYDAVGNLISTAGIPCVPSTNIAAYDAEGRPTKMTSVAGTSPLVSNVLYGFFGPTYALYGSGDTDTFSYDALGHMQLYKTTVGPNIYSGSLAWNANGTPGNLWTVDTVPGNGGGSGITVNYNYDDLGRLWKASGGDLSQTYSYDKYGNLATSGSPYSWNPPSGYNLDNRYVTEGSCNGTGICYDTEGNLLSDTFNTYTWNAENKLVGETSGSITLDAFNRTVEVNGYEHLFAPGLGDIGLFSGQTPQQVTLPLPGSGSVVYGVQCTGVPIGYNHKDWHGNTRITTTQSQGLLRQAEFSPFGQLYDKTSCCQPLQFDSANMETLTNVYDMPNRNLHSIQGRWIQPDPAGRRAVDVTNPQSWNRYAYVLNNPLSFNDPTGLACVGGKDDDSGGQSCAEVAAADAEYQKQQRASATVTATPPPTFFSRIDSWLFSLGAVISRSLGSMGGDRAGKPFTTAGKRLVISRSAEANGGQPTCVNCGQPTVPAQQSQAGVTPPGNETNVDHIYPQSENGNGDPETNGQLLCRDCNLTKSNSLPITDEPPSPDFSEQGRFAAFAEQEYLDGISTSGVCGMSGTDPCN